MFSKTRVPLALFLGAAALFANLTVDDLHAQNVPTAAVLETRLHNAGPFTIQLPVGWKLISRGEGSTLAFLARDPRNPLRQVFFFGLINPLYADPRQPAVDLRYMRGRGYPVAHYGNPVIAPVTAENFLSQWSAVMRAPMAQRFMPEAPHLNGINLIWSVPAPRVLPMGSTKLMRAFFVQDRQLGEGLFSATVYQTCPFTGAPGGGKCAAAWFTGITAPKRELAALQADLTRVIQSFRVDPRYARRYVNSLVRSGPMLSDTSDMIMNGWLQRNKRLDIVAEKRSDAILGSERVYDPTTRQVYEFGNGFYEQYRLKRHQYQMSNLQPLPDKDHALWTAAPLNGPKQLH